MKDFQYNKVMPTFHHWRTGDKKFGLTFQTAADARAFDKGVRNAVVDILDGESFRLFYSAAVSGLDSFQVDGESIYSYGILNIDKKIERFSPKGIGYVHNFHGADVGEDEVFMTLELPVDSRSSSGSSSESGNGIGAYRPTSTTPSIPGDTFSATSSPYAHPNVNQHHLHRMHFIRPSRTMPGVNNNGSGTSGLTSSMSAGAGDLQRVQGEEIWVKERTSYKDQHLVDNDKIEPLSPSEPYSYVQFAKGRPSRAEHEYSYPAIESMKSGKQDLGGSFKKPYQLAAIGSEPPLLPIKKKSSKKESRRHSPSGRVHCRHCLDTFSEEENQQGSCEYAPDRMLACINAATCISCAQCMLYHCMSDAEGDFNQHPCSCDVAEDHCRRRWTGLALLSIFVPCLWCYLPLRACHRCGVSCGFCGGKHEAA